MPVKSFEHSKLFQIFRLLDRKECRRLHLWLKSKWPRQHQIHLDLFEILLPYHPNFQLIDKDRHIVYKRLFPDKPIDLSRLATLMSSLTLEVEEFLIHEKLNTDHVQKKILLAQVYRERGKAEIAEKKTEQVIQALEAKAPKSWEDLLNLCLLNEVKHRSSVYNGKTAASTKQLDLIDANHYLDWFYKMGKYRFLLELSEREKILAEDHSITDHRLLLQQIPNREYSAAIELYSALLANQENSQQQFQLFIELYLQYYPDLNQMDKRVILFYLINHGARLRLKGNNQVLPQLLDLYKLGITTKLIYLEERITASTFANVVTIGNLIGDSEFVKSFIHHNKVKLAPAIRQDATIWAKTHYAFNSKDPEFWKIAINLNQMGSVKSTFVIRTRVLNIQMWFEDFIQGKVLDVNFMLGICDAFIKQLKRSAEYDADRLDALRGFVKTTKDLVRLRSRNKLNLTYLLNKKEDISKAKNIHAQNWLLNQIDILIKE